MKPRPIFFLFFSRCWQRTAQCMSLHRLVLLALPPSLPWHWCSGVQETREEALGRITEQTSAKLCSRLALLADTWFWL